MGCQREKNACRESFQGLPWGYVISDWPSSLLWMMIQTVEHWQPTDSQLKDLFHRGSNEMYLKRGMLGGVMYISEFQCKIMSVWVEAGYFLLCCNKRQVNLYLTSTQPRRPGDVEALEANDLPNNIMASRNSLRFLDQSYGVKRTGYQISTVSCNVMNQKLPIRRAV